MGECVIYMSFPRSVDLAQRGPLRVQFKLFLDLPCAGPVLDGALETRCLAACAFVGDLAFEAAVATAEHHVLATQTQDGAEIVGAVADVDGAVVGAVRVNVTREFLACARGRECRRRGRGGDDAGRTFAHVGFAADGASVLGTVGVDTTAEDECVGVCVGEGGWVGDDGIEEVSDILVLLGVQSITIAITMGGDRGDAPGEWYR